MACHSDHAGPKLTRRDRKPFTHALLRGATQDRCSTCHIAPANALHKALSVGCDKCHQTEAWKPASFDHNKYFPLDQDHNPTCVTCHAGNNYQQYTCYGCHEHTPATMQAKHREEGIGADLEHCVRCHRTASGEGEGHGERGNAERGQRDRGEGQRERD
jgi:hypothetical protein